jgi:hypothetical protein
MIAENCLALRYAMVAYSALVYSMKVIPNSHGSRVFSFGYYQMALQELRILLDEVSIGSRESFTMALATALQLASFDVRSF